MRNSAAAIGAASLGGVGACAQKNAGKEPATTLAKTIEPHSGNLFIEGRRNPKFTLDRPITDEVIAAKYNNFYEFTVAKGGVWRLAQKLTVRPWTVAITGEVKKPATLDVDDITRKMPVEERLYRFRCVEAWAMAVPWTGFPFKALLDLVEPTSNAKFVHFESFYRPEEAVGQKRGEWKWPYYEGITLEEATNELAFIANGIYGHELPKQHGAPLRMVLPWKYGYKSIKSIVKIELTREQPHTFWNDYAPNEYGFCSNVNPKKPHPRWSQATERIIGNDERRPTLPYNGYGEFVHKLYKGTPNEA